MEKIIAKSVIKINQVNTKFTRYLYNQIDISQRFIAIKGARGVGKTTLLLQIGKEMTKSKSVLYVALDDLYFLNRSLYGLAEEFQLKGGQVLLLDEVHKYTSWSRELKLIYDDFPNLHVIFTSSSILDIYKGESDLSRRVVHYTLKEMSYREFLQFQKNISLSAYTLDDILTHHTNIAAELIGQFKPYEHFEEYLKFGAFPYYQNDEHSYQQKVIQTISLILEVDLPSIENIDYKTIVKIKRLLYVLAANVPFTPNISKLSQQLDLTRNSLVQLLQLLQKANLIHTLYQQTKSISSLNKPDKIWLRNTNLMYGLAGSNVDIGTIRETFILQMLAETHRLALPKHGDILIDEKYVIEIGGKSKTTKQIAQLNNAFLVKDKVEIGFNNTLPMWLFGLLY